jgi:hypothetical protein
MVPSARRAAMRMGLADCIDRAAIAAGSALFPVYRWDLTESLKPNHAGGVRDKVAPGPSPAAQATLARRRGSLDGRVLSRRYHWLPL